jgi:hypothetical protein
MTKFSTPDELIKIAEVNKNNAEKIEKINIIMRETACFGRRECHIYDSDLWNNEIISELINSGYTVREEVQGFLETPCLHISW